MSQRRVIFILDRFADCRIWADIPDRLTGQAEVIHLDQHTTLPWTGGDGAVVAAAAGDPMLAGGEDVVRGDRRGVPARRRVSRGRTGRWPGAVRPGGSPPASRARSGDAILRMLERVG
jgi:hypothetical protein